MSFINKHHSEETKRKISLATKGNKSKLGQKDSIETRNKKSLAHHNHSIYKNLERNIKISRARKKFFSIKENHPMYNKFHKESTKEKIRQARLNQKIPTKFTSIELKIKEILDSLNIPYKTHKSVMGITQPDFFIEPNICIYCDGNYWHNLPKAIERDKKINKILKFSGYKIIRLTETQIKNNIDNCKNIIMQI